MYRNTFYNFDSFHNICKIFLTHPCFFLYANSAISQFKSGGEEELLQYNLSIIISKTYKTKVVHHYHCVCKFHFSPKNIKVRIII